jgi:hypothetical protein
VRHPSLFVEEYSYVVQPQADFDEPKIEGNDASAFSGFFQSGTLYSVP